jgi:drug/metabolite transporter (DMT)-like permease
VIAKEASAAYDAYELDFYRSLACTLWAWAELRLRGLTLRTSMPMGHAARSATGAVALLLWFAALGGLPVATAVTLNLTSSVWLAGFAVCGALLLGRVKVQLQLLGAVLFGFGGIALVLQPSIGRDQFWFGAAALASGLLTAIACLTISALGRAGEPVSRIFFYSSVNPAVAGAALAAVGNGFHEHTAQGLAVLCARHRGFVGADAEDARLLHRRNIAQRSAAIPVDRLLVLRRRLAVRRAGHA